MRSDAVIDADTKLTKPQREAEKAENAAARNSVVDNPARNTDGSVRTTADRQAEANATQIKKPVDLANHENGVVKNRASNKKVLSDSLVELKKAVEDNNRKGIDATIVVMENALKNI